MRKFFVLIAINVLLLALGSAAAPTEEDSTAAPTKKCQEVCKSEEKLVVCGYDGTCYKQFKDKCAYDLEKCTKRNSLETVDISLCELAVKDNHPKFKTCAE